MTILAAAASHVFTRRFSGAEQSNTITGDPYRRTRIDAGCILDVPSHAGDVWTHWRINSGFASLGFNLLELWDATRGFLVLEFTPDSVPFSGQDGYVRFQWWNGSSYSNGPVIAQVPNLTESTIDVSLIGNEATLYINGIRYGSQVCTGLTRSNTVAAYFFSFDVSEIVVASASTIGARVVELYPTGAGTEQQQDSGTFADIDDIVPSQSSLMQMTASDRAAFTFPSSPLDDTFLSAVVVASEHVGTLNHYIRLGSGIVDGADVDTIAFDRKQTVFATTELPSEIGVRA